MHKNSAVGIRIPTVGGSPARVVPHAPGWRPLTHQCHKKTLKAGTVQDGTGLQRRKSPHAEAGTVTCAPRRPQEARRTTRAPSKVGSPRTCSVTAATARSVCDTRCGRVPGSCDRRGPLTRPCGVGGQPLIAIKAIPDPLTHLYTRKPLQRACNMRFAAFTALKLIVSTMAHRSLTRDIVSRIANPND